MVSLPARTGISRTRKLAYRVHFREQASLTKPSPPLTRGHRHNRLVRTANFKSHILQGKSDDQQTDKDELEIPRIVLGDEVENGDSDGYGQRQAGHSTIF